MAQSCDVSAGTGTEKGSPESGAHRRPAPRQVTPSCTGGPHFTGWRRWRQDS